MPYSHLKPLLQPSGGKIVLLVMDGLGGLPMEPNGPTELEHAHTPNLDRLADMGAIGQTVPIRNGVTPGSGPAHLALFGYDPLEYEIGRGVLEAFGINLPVGANDVAARGNFCTLDADGKIQDRRAGRISNKEAAPVADILRSIAVAGVSVDVRHVKEHRFAVVMRGDGLCDEISDTDPQAAGVPPLRAQARTAAAELTADLFNRWIDAAHLKLADQKRANGLTLRGFSKDPGLPSYKDVYGVRAACIAAYPMYRGVAKLVGMDVIDFDGDAPADEFAALAEVWDDYDFFFVHIKKTDSYGEDGDFEAKSKVIASVDAALPQLIGLNPEVLVVTGDHSTPALMRAHSWHPVPFLLWAPKLGRPDDRTTFGERACARGGLGTFPAVDTMSLALAHAGRLSKFGA